MNKLIMMQVSWFCNVFVVVVLILTPFNPIGMTIGCIALIFNTLAIVGNFWEISDKLEKLEKFERMNR